MSRDLWCGIPGRSTQGKEKLVVAFIQLSGQPEIENLDGSRGRTKANVGRFEITVSDPFLVQVGSGRSEIHGVCQPFSQKGTATTLRSRHETGWYPGLTMHSLAPFKEPLL